MNMNRSINAGARRLLSRNILARVCFKNDGSIQSFESFSNFGFWDSFDDGVSFLQLYSGVTMRVFSVQHSEYYFIVHFNLVSVVIV